MTRAVTDDRGWTVDKRLNLGNLVSIITGLVVVISLVVGLDARLEMAEAKLCKVEQQVEDMRETAIKVERIDVRVSGIHSTLIEIKDELKRVD